jgi:hypothetical protein
MRFYFYMGPLLGINEYWFSKLTEVIVKNGGMNSPNYGIETTITPVYQSFAALFDRPVNDFSKHCSTRFVHVNSMKFMLIGFLYIRVYLLMLVCLRWSAKYSYC